MLSATLLRKSMRVSAGATLLLLTSGLVAAFAQGMGDGQSEMNATPIQAGYVIVTPSSGDPGALVVFETFGERRGKDTPQAGVLPSSLSNKFLLFVSKSGRLSRNLGVAIANPNPSAATVDLILRGSDGVEVARAVPPITVDAGHQVAKMVTEIFGDQASVPQDFVGTLEVSSTVPVAVIGLRFRGMNFSTLPATQIGPTAEVPAAGGVGGPEAVVLPHFVTGGGWATEIVLVNLGLSELILRVDLFKQDGTPLSAQLNGVTDSTFLDVKIPAGGVKVLSQRDMHGDSDF